MLADKCGYCKEDMKSPYTFKDAQGNWHYAHKHCCNILKKKINAEYLGERPLLEGYSSGEEGGLLTR